MPIFTANSVNEMGKKTVVKEYQIRKKHTNVQLKYQILVKNYHTLTDRIDQD